MTDTFDVFRYIGYLGSRWRLIAASCGIAGTLALAVSLATPREYTATTRIVIEPPSGSDPRGAVAVSPIYLESLKTYELFASSDSLFQKAVERFGLRQMLGGRPIESLKKRVLKVALVRNTRILEIEATLPEARTAQVLAFFLAEATVKLNESLVNQDEMEILDAAEREEKAARARVEEVEAALARPGAGTADLPERKAAQDALVAARVRLLEARSGAGYRGERLTVIDPGIVPERPSAPNLPLNVAAALLLGLVLPVLYLTFEMHRPERWTGAARFRSLEPTLDQ